MCHGFMNNPRNRHVVDGQEEQQAMVNDILRAMRAKEPQRPKIQERVVWNACLHKYVTVR
jgi:hypothetical protein